ncbi:MAG: 50S ribosomal protein L13 [Planctomycetes bacterium]|nr:50S ribosomal protein L13 [Planctomycetota bacterium]
MTKTTFATQQDHQAAASDWYIVDASEHVLGRMAVRIAEALMGKDKPLYTPHVSIGAGVIVINAERVLVTGDKKDDRIYTHWSGYSGGLHSRSLGERLSQSPERLIKDAVRRMLPKSRAGTAMTARLKVYRGAEHPHTAQQPKKLEIPR